VTKRQEEKEMAKWRNGEMAKWRNGKMLKWRDREMAENQKPRFLVWAFTFSSSLVIWLTESESTEFMNLAENRPMPLVMLV
jgi:hypothetical protein